jgi:AcrR family transcriptional regulator
MATFQRARSDEQRAMRSKAILDTAAAMLEEMPVAEITLNELSRQVGLAKSNVLRYFDSREAVLLELLDRALSDWVDQLEREVPAAVSARAGFRRRAEQLAAAFAASLAQRPVLCDLASTQSAVLERNVTTEAILAHKRRAVAHGRALTAVVADALPELGEERAWQYSVDAMLMAGALWTACRPPAALVDAYAQDPELAGMRLEFEDALEAHLVTVALGLQAQA